MGKTAVTQKELEAIRAYHADRQRAWWNGQSPEERRERRNRYALNAIKKKLGQIDRSENDSGRKRRNKTRANGY